MALLSGKARAGRHAPDGRFPPLHHRRRDRAQAHERQGFAVGLREPRRRPHREGHPALQKLHAGRGTVSFFFLPFLFFVFCFFFFVLSELVFA